MTLFEHALPTVVILAALLLGLAAVAASFVRFVRRDAFGGLIALARLAFLLLLAWCLFLPARRDTEVRRLKPRFLIALDTSASMQLAPAPDVSNRWQAAQHVLTRPWADAVAAECDVDLYSVGAQLGARRDRHAAGELTPDEPATRLRDALRKLTERYAGQNVAGLLLLSDGLDTREESEDWAGDAWPWPLYTASFEPAAAWEREPDVHVESADTPRRVTLGWQTELKSVLSGQGLGDAAINVRLLRDGAPVQEQPIRLPPEGARREVAFALTHPDVGVFTYTVCVAPLPGETHTNDNVCSVSVQVVDTKNRLLYVEGTPRWESKYLTRVLKASRQVTPLCFIRGPNQQFLTVGQGGGQTAELTPEQLALFTIVILGNLDAEELGAARADNLVRFVDAGGSLILLGGSKAWGAAGFSRTPLAKLLPVRLHGTKMTEGKFAAALTPAGRAHPAFGGDTSLWDTLPPVLSYVPGIELSPAAELLAQADTAPQPTPLLVTQAYGQGRVVALLTDSLWRWCLDPDAGRNRPYQRFWDQILAWLTPEEQKVEQAPLDLLCDGEQTFLGERVELSARLRADTAAPAAPAVEVVCEITLPDGRRLPFQMAAGAVATADGKSFAGYKLAYTPEAPGLHQASAVTRSNGREQRSAPVAFFVRPFTPESLPRPAARVLLERLAHASGGAFFDTPAALDAALSQQAFKTLEEETVHYVTLWQQPAVIACLLALLALEWSLRKWRNLP